MFILFGAVEVLHGYKYIRFTMLLAGFLVWCKTQTLSALVFCFARALALTLDLTPIETE